MEKEVEGLRQDVKNLRQRVVKFEQAYGCALGDLLSEEERMLVQMYRTLRKVEAPDPQRLIVVTGDGAIEFGYE